MTAPLIKRGQIRNIVGVEVDALDLSLLVNTDVTYANVPLTQFARQGGFDGARVEVVRFFSKNWRSPACGSLNLFSGRVAPLTVSGSEIKMSVKSDLELLDIPMPHNTYMAQCQHALYDSGCTLSAAAFTVTGNVTANSTTANVNCNLAQTAGYFALGVMKFTSGQNNQVQRSIRIHATGILVPVQPLPFAPAVGDQFTVRPGCDKQQTTCDVKFSNLPNFRGYPFIPAPENSY